MEIVYAALLLHSAGKPISEDSVTKVLESTGEKPNHAMVKALVSSLEGVNIEEAIKASQAVAPAAAPAEAKKEEKEDKKKAEDEKKKAEEAVEGLSSLFG